MINMFMVFDVLSRWKSDHIKVHLCSECEAMFGKAPPTKQKRTRLHVCCNTAGRNHGPAEEMLQPMAEQPLGAGREGYRANPVSCISKEHCSEDLLHIFPMEYAYCDKNNYVFKSCAHTKKTITLENNHLICPTQTAKSSFDLQPSFRTGL